MFTKGDTTRMHIFVSGIVQGVGFRPFVHNLAQQHSLTGSVRNSAGSVEIEVQGSDAAVKTFIGQLRSEAPVRALIKDLHTSILAPVAGQACFQILDSNASNTVGLPRFLPADTATCKDCLDELFDKSNRRYRYPFINCVNCGPRFTIITALPYDRQSTTIADFTMCACCQAEYENPGDRRFHAQPNACAQCGPSLSYLDAQLMPGDLRNDWQDEAALSFSLKQLAEGKIVAVKGLGGFHLFADAGDESAIGRLRKRKRRNHKPFALMMADLEMVRRYCVLSEEEAHELTGTIRPIVLVDKLETCELPPELAPGIDRLGVMLPYTPLHHLMLADYGKPVIATSANFTEEPIAIDNEEAMARLDQIADGFLLHDRKIHSGYDDSVLHFVGSHKYTLRRARGLAPLPIPLPFRSQVSAFASGAHLKNTFCFIDSDQAFVSQHLGDLDNIETHDRWHQTFQTYSRLFQFKPQIVGHDSHPDYASTVFAIKIAADNGLPIFSVQHHHAHIVSCMIEHGLTQPVLGVCFDGLGYGLDGTLWGGEFMRVSLADCQRLAHFHPVPLPGASQAIKQPWRMALSHLASSGIAPNSQAMKVFRDRLCRRYTDVVVEYAFKQIEKKLNSPLTSSCGRLFDAVSALLDVCQLSHYEGQAAIELEALATRAESTLQFREADIYPFQIDNDSMPFVIKQETMVQALYADWLQGLDRGKIALKFHHTIAQIIKGVCLITSQSTGLRTICLAGGVFQNRLLARISRKLLEEAGLDVYFPQLLPANDGGLSLGQAVIALAQADAIILSS